MITCTAIIEADNIYLAIRKEEDGYEDFARVLTQIKNRGFMTWYGDIVNTNGNEQSGLIITSKL